MFCVLAKLTAWVANSARFIPFLGLPMAHSSNPQLCSADPPPKYHHLEVFHNFDSFSSSNFLRHKPSFVKLFKLYHCCCRNKMKIFHQRKCFLVPLCHYLIH